MQTLPEAYVNQLDGLARFAPRECCRDRLHMKTFLIIVRARICDRGELFY